MFKLPSVGKNNVYVCRLSNNKHDRTCK